MATSPHPHAATGTQASSSRVQYTKKMHRRILINVILEEKE
jgi:hypothetical protein